MTSPGNSFSTSAPASSADDGLGRRHHARGRDEAQRLGCGDDGGVGVGRDDDASARLRPRRRHRRRGRRCRRRPRRARPAPWRGGRCCRAARASSAAPRGRVMPAATSASPTATASSGLQAAQDGDERAAGEGGVEGGEVATWHGPPRSGGAGDRPRNGAAGPRRNTSSRRRGSRAGTPRRGKARADRQRAQHALGDDDDRARPASPHGASPWRDLRADQQAGQKGPDLRARHVAHAARACGPRTAWCVRPPGRAAAARPRAKPASSAGSSASLPRIVWSLQRAVEIAGHEGGEALDPAARACAPTWRGCRA